METTVSKVYAALPGTLEQIVAKAGVPRAKARKALHNMQSRKQIKRTGERGNSTWSVNKSGPKPKFVTYDSPQKRAWKTRKKKKVKRKYTKRKNKHPALLVYLETLEARIANLEKIIGV